MATNDDNTLPAFWPTIAAAGRAMSRDAVFQKVNCGICLQDLDIAGVTFPGLAHPRDYNLNRHHAAVALPCGHVFGAACLQSFAAHNAPAVGSWRPRHCPSCRSFLSLGCGHPVAGRRLPLFAGECGTCLVGQRPSQNTMEERCDSCDLAALRRYVAPFEQECASRPAAARPSRPAFQLYNIVARLTSFRDSMARRARGEEGSGSDSDSDSDSDREAAINAVLESLRTTADFARYLAGEKQYWAELEAKIAAPAQHAPGGLRFLMAWESPASDAVVDRRMHCQCH